MEYTERKAIETYKENLDYLSRKNKSLYDRIALLETAIGEGLYKERYALEYKENSYFDIVDLHTGNWLYGENSIEHAKRIADNVNLRRDNGVFEAQRHVDFSPNMPDIIDKSVLSFHNALWASIKVIEYYKKNVSMVTYMKRAHKMMFLGIGLGLHIPSVINKLSPAVLFLKENNLEIFRLSLFVTNYSKLSKKVEMFFSIMEDATAKKGTFIHFLERGNNYNLNIKQISLTTEDEKELLEYQSYVMMQEHIVYPYSAYLLRYIESPKYIVNGYPFLDISHMHQSKLWENKPVLLLFSGPSTAKNIEWLKQNRQKFITFSALSTCKYLFKQGIKPDVVVHIDPGEEETLLLLDGIDKEYFNDIICLFSGNINERVVKYFSNNPVYFIQQATHYKQGFGSFSAASVGEYTYAVSLILGANNIYILGIDLALDPDTLASHSPDHPFALSGDASSEASDERLDTVLIEVAGNFLEKVPTFAIHDISIKEFARMSGIFKKNQEVYNLSNGALLEGAEPKQVTDECFKEFSLMDAKQINDEIREFFDSISSNVYRMEDRENIATQLHYAKQLMNVIAQYNKLKFTMPSFYIDALDKLNHKLSDMDSKTNSDLSMVYYLYFKVVFSYICEIFNTQGLERPKEHIEAINTILLAQLNKIGNTYIDRFEEYLKER